MRIATAVLIKGTAAVLRGINVHDDVLKLEHAVSQHVPMGLLA